MQIYFQDIVCFSLICIRHNIIKRSSPHTSEECSFFVIGGFYKYAPKV